MICILAANKTFSRNQDETWYGNINTLQISDPHLQNSRCSFPISWKRFVSFCNSHNTLHQGMLRMLGKEASHLHCPSTCNIRGDRVSHTTITHGAQHPGLQLCDLPFQLQTIRCIQVAQTINTPSTETPKASGSAQRCDCPKASFSTRPIRSLSARSQHTRL